MSSSRRKHYGSSEYLLQADTLGKRTASKVELQDPESSSPAPAGLQGEEQVCEGRDLQGKKPISELTSQEPDSEKLSKKSLLSGEIKSEVRAHSQGFSDCCIFCYKLVSASFMAKNVL